MIRVLAPLFIIVSAIPAGVILTKVFTSGPLKDNRLLVMMIVCGETAFSLGLAAYLYFKVLA